MPTKQQKFPLSKLLGNCPFNRHEITKQYQKHNYLVKIYKQSIYMHIYCLYSGNCNIYNTLKCSKKCITTKSTVERNLCKNHC